MKKVFLISLFAFFATAAFAQEADVNQYGQTVESVPVEAKMQDGILVFQNKNANYKMWFDVRVQADAAVYFGAPDFCAKEIDGKWNTSHIGNGMNLRRTRFAVKAQLDKNWYGELDTDWTSGTPELKDAYVAFTGVEGLEIKVEACFARDKFLTDTYNNVMAGGKWKNMMIQKHIGYTIWNDSFPADILPEVFRIDAEPFAEGYTFSPSDGYIAIEAPHIFSRTGSEEGSWTLIPDMGRTLGGVALMPYTVPVDGAFLTYRMNIPADVKNVTVYVATKSTLAFHDADGHSYRVGFKGGETVERCFNEKLNEKPENVYSIYYPTVARRVAIEKIDLELPENQNGVYELVVEPLDPGIVFEKFVIDFGGYEESYLMGKESSYTRE